MALHIVIGDAHVDPEVSNERFEWCGRFVADRKPDVVIDIGDWSDMPSLCPYDKGTKGFEGRRYKRDIEWTIDSRNLFRCSLIAVLGNNVPRLVSCIGNHEHRIDRAIDVDATQLEGVISIGDLEHENYGWEVVPFLEPIQIDGITYCHYFAAGIMDRPIGGEHGAYTVLAKKSMSCVWGHSHLLDFCTRNDAMGRKIAALNAGCYFEHDLSYVSKQVNSMLNRGLAVVTTLDDGGFDLEWVSMERIKEMYA